MTDSCDQPEKTKRSFKFITFTALAAIFLFGFVMAKDRLFSPDVDAINAHPSILSKKRIIKKKLEGLEISNAHIVGMVMEDVDAEGAEIKNITFENCTFTRVFMLYSHFENVAFKNCIIQNKGDAEVTRNNTIFARSLMKNVLFENTKLRNVDMTAITGQHGYVFFRNMRDVYPPGGVGNILSGGSLHIRIVDSDIDLAYFNSSNKKNASFYAKNSKFKNPLIKSDLLYMENCYVIDGALTSYQTMVVKNTTMRPVAYIVPHKTAYLLNNIYENNDPNPRDEWGVVHKQNYQNVRISGEPESHTYVLQQGKQKEPAHLNLQEGSVTVHNLKFFDMSLFPRAGDIPQPPTKEINLRNVEVLNWSDWEEREILGGKWENVKIHGPIVVGKTKIENIQAYKLTFPSEDRLEKKGDFVFDVTKSLKPFEWEEIKVPTPEDLGLEWWPMEPGYHPEK